MDSEDTPQERVNHIAARVTEALKHVPSPTERRYKQFLEDLQHEVNESIDIFKSTLLGPGPVVQLPTILISAYRRRPQAFPEHIPSISRTDLSVQGHHLYLRNGPRAPTPPLILKLGDNGKWWCDDDSDVEIVGSRDESVDRSIESLAKRPSAPISDAVAPSSLEYNTRRAKGTAGPPKGSLEHWVLEVNAMEAASSFTRKKARQKVDSDDELDDELEDDDDRPPPKKAKAPSGSAKLKPALVSQQKRKYHQPPCNPCKLHGKPCLDVNPTPGSQRACGTCRELKKRCNFAAPRGAAGAASTKAFVARPNHKSARSNDVGAGSDRQDPAGDSPVESPVNSPLPYSSPPDPPLPSPSPSTSWRDSFNKATRSAPSERALGKRPAINSGSPPTAGASSSRPNAAGRSEPPTTTQKIDTPSGDASTLEQSAVRERHSVDVSAFIQSMEGLTQSHRSLEEENTQLRLRLLEVQLIEMRDRIKMLENQLSQR
ncbi:hypothetical protein BV22DRAFT_301149 [Leucogyrophana mollusca]|uniref:Uncharacterized protein n=1 Tax=Leucogyrophana mollusca TaxID=85980 RepID=A0ACB8BP01_9AGAM|nr:hypothetical protein BV22DRAFT_301149 [Leucogyrophana mollusca]